MTPAEHYEAEAAEAGELRHLKELLAHAVPLAEHLAKVAEWAACVAAKDAEIAHLHKQLGTKPTPDQQDGRVDRCARRTPTAPKGVLP